MALDEMSEKVQMPMESGTCSLNDDVLVEIFSYIDTDHLIMTLCEVCVHWRHLIAHDSRIWSNRWLEWDLSKPINALDIYLNRAPLLKKLKLTSALMLVVNTTDTDLSLRNVLCKFPRICEIEINCFVASDILHCINRNLLHLNVSHICRQDYSILMQFKAMETLKFGDAYDFCGYHLRLIADECKNLKDLHIPDCRSLITPDVVYFLEKKKFLMESLEINGYGLTDEAFALLPQCKNLKYLLILDSRLMSSSVFVDILHSGIQELHLLRLNPACFVNTSQVKKKTLRLTFDLPKMF